MLHCRAVNRAGKLWAKRRQRTVELTALELIVQIVNTCFYLAPNAYGEVPAPAAASTAQVAALQLCISPVAAESSNAAQCLVSSCFRGDT